MSWSTRRRARAAGSLRRRLPSLLAVGVVCAGLGAGVSAIATAGAATSGSAAASHAHRLRALGRIPGVHDQFVVHTRSGFKTLTLDRGFVESVSGDTLTIREGTENATYRTASLTVAADARVRNNGHRAALSSLSRGERVAVLHGLPRTWVIAHTPKS